MFCVPGIVSISIDFMGKEKMFIKIKLKRKNNLPKKIFVNNSSECFTLIRYINIMNILMHDNI